MQQLFSTEAFKNAEAGIPGPAVRQLRLARFPLSVDADVPNGNTLICGYLPPGATIIPKLFCIDDPDNPDTPLFLDYARAVNEGTLGVDFSYDAVEFVKPDGTSVSNLTEETTFPEGCKVRLTNVSGLLATHESQFLYLFYL